MLFRHDNLISYFKVNFALMQFHKYNLTEIENMMPWERMIYVDLLNQYIEKENEKERDRQFEMAARRR